MKTPRVALVHDHLNQFGGGEVVLAALHEMYPGAPIYTSVAHLERTKQRLPNAEIRTSFLQKLPRAKKSLQWYLPLLPSAFESFDFSEFDIVISDSSAFAKAVIVNPGAVHIDYCHTPTRYLWTDHASYVRDLKYPGFVKNAVHAMTSYLRTVDRQAADRVDMFIANSKTVQKRIGFYYRKQSVVINPPVDVDQMQVAPTEEIGDYYLIVSRLRPYKKADLAVQAFNRMNIPLKIIGAGEEMARLKGMAKSNIEFLGEVDNATRNHYLSRCKAFIHPQEEDFGISAVEAMAAGRPVIAYGKGGATETVVDGVTGKLFSEQTWEDLADAVIRSRSIAFDPQAIRKHAEQFSKARFQEQVAAVVETVWEKRKADSVE